METLVLIRGRKIRFFKENGYFYFIFYFNNSVFFFFNAVYRASCAHLDTLVSIDRIPSICLDGRIIYIRACYKFEDNFGKVRKRTGNLGCCLNNRIESVFFLRIIKMSKEKRKIGWRQLTIFVRVEINLNRIDGSICRD